MLNQEFIDTYYDELRDAFNEAMSNAIILDRKEFIKSFRPLLAEIHKTAREMQVFYESHDKSECINKVKNDFPDVFSFLISSFLNTTLPVTYLDELYDQYKAGEYQKLKLDNDVAVKVLKTLLAHNDDNVFAVEKRIVLKGICMESLSVGDFNRVIAAFSFFIENKELDKFYTALSFENRYLIFSKNEKSVNETFLSYKGSFRSLLRNILTPSMMELANKHTKCPKSLKFEEYEKGDYANAFQKDMFFKLKSLKYLQHIVNTELYEMSLDESYQSIADELHISKESLKNDFSEIKKIFKY